MVVLAVLRKTGTPPRPGGHHTLRQTGQVAQLGGGGSRTQAQLPINWSGNYELKEEKKKKKEGFDFVLSNTQSTQVYC